MLHIVLYKSNQVLQHDLDQRNLQTVKNTHTQTHKYTLARDTQSNHWGQSGENNHPVNWEQFSR